MAPHAFPIFLIVSLLFSLMWALKSWIISLNSTQILIGSLSLCFCFSYLAIFELIAVFLTLRVIKPHFSNMFIAFNVPDTIDKICKLAVSMSIITSLSTIYFDNIFGPSLLHFLPLVKLLLVEIFAWNSNSKIILLFLANYKKEVTRIRLDHVLL